MFFKLNLKISSIGLVLEYLNAPGPVRQKTDRSVILTDRYVRVCFTLRMQVVHSFWKLWVRVKISVKPCHLMSHLLSFTHLSMTKEWMHPFLGGFHILSSLPSPSLFLSPLLPSHLPTVLWPKSLFKPSSPPPPLSFHPISLPVLSLQPPGDQNM